ncbi:MAG: hypothetical protein Q7K65_02885 [Candidatus Buchananbacteria bacterium]|nr:hypothetical protein [Candidatus Buchananbacteria bacterium]
MILKPKVLIAVVIIILLLVGGIFLYRQYSINTVAGNYNLDEMECKSNGWKWVSKSSECNTPRSKLCQENSDGTRDCIKDCVEVKNYDGCNNCQVKDKKLVNCTSWDCALYQDPICIKNRPITESYCAGFNYQNCPNGCETGPSCSICTDIGCHIEGYRNNAEYWK